MKKYITLGLLFTVVTSLFSQSKVLFRDEQQKAWVDSVYAQLSMDEKIGQLFIVAAYSNKDAGHENAIQQLVSNEGIGGLIFMQDNADQQVQLTNRYQASAKIPLLIGMDAEWGLAMRLKKSHKFPYAMTLGAIQNDSLIFQLGQKIALHCQEMGVHWNFAPVVDVNTNPKNPIIGNRSFGSDVDNVSRKGIAYANGMKSEYVLASAKHFPGHGDTSSDSHKTLPVIDHPLTRLQQTELAPFQNLINAGVTGIMVAHLDVPNLEPNGLPSTLSKSIVTDLLQSEMGFEGLIITDALNMQGVASKYPAGIVDLKAFEAGNDILLFSQNVSKAKSEILKKIESGELTKERLETSVKKILRAKYFVGLSHQKSLNTSPREPILNDQESVQLSNTLYENAITLVKNNGVLPFIEGERVYFIPMGKGYNTFSSELSNYTNIQSIGNASSLVNEKVVIGLFKDTSTPYKSYKISASEKQKIEQIAKNNEVTLVLFTSAYALKYVNTTHIDNVIVAYENNVYTQRLVPKMLYGNLPILGRLPAEVSASLPYGSGQDLVIEDRIMPRATPESQGMRSDILNEIDAMAQKSIERHETPGMQVLVAKNGKIIYNRQFGYLDYSNQQRVESRTLYDLASLTKVLSTLPLFMKMYDAQEVSLDDRIENYFPYVQNTDKAYIRFRELLLHNSGLKSWIPFHKATLDFNNQPSAEYYQNLIAAQYQNPVANGLFSRFTVRDMVYTTIANSALEPKTYDYSDLGFYIIQYTIEQQNKQPQNVVFEREIANPLGLKRLTYRPLEKFPMEEIAPTEIDNYYRYQTLRGTVQDQGAALFGGVAGHAGLFGNAEEVCAIMQMYLDGGVFNGQNLIEGGTIGYFSSYQNSSRRGLGFDKQKGDEGPFFDNAPSSGFGHTGFTGTMVWADPYEQLVFVFLSNRTYPDSSVNRLHKNKTRPKMLKKVYEAIL